MEIHLGRLRLVISLFGLVIIGGSHPASLFPQTANVPAKLTYSRTFQGSLPEYLQITVDSKGFGAFEGRKLDETRNPCPFRLSPKTTERIFALAAQLHNFQSIDLESHRKVANLGQKALEYQTGNDVNRVVFNYTENRVAQELVEILEGVSTVEEHVTALEFEMKYEPLGLPEELLQIQIELREKSLADPELLIPTLEKIAHNSRFLHLAQARAQDLIERLQSNP
jgi:hypothetical protein